MKVTLGDRYKDRFTVSDLERARAVISDLKEDSLTVKEYATAAVRMALEYRGMYLMLDRVLDASAHTEKNRRTWNSYSEDSADMDVWIDAIAETYDGFVRIGTYLTDIWHEEVGLMFFRMYKEV